MASSPITLWQIEEEKVETVTDFIFLASTSLCMVTAIMKMLAPSKESYDKARQYIKKKRHQFADKGLYKSKLRFFQ